MSIDIANSSRVEIDSEELRKLARFVLNRMGIHPLAELSILLVDADAMEKLHLQWMNEPGPTDVLAFPMDELRPGSDDQDAESQPGLLGDVVLCPVVAGDQARQAGHSVSHELRLLCVHGILHLLGYDHVDAEQKREMFNLQDELLGAWQQERGRNNSDHQEQP